jgi:hypothetical protein
VLGASLSSSTETGASPKSTTLLARVTFQQRSWRTSKRTSCKLQLPKLVLCSLAYLPLLGYFLVCSSPLLGLEAAAALDA